MSMVADTSTQIGQARQQLHSLARRFALKQAVIFLPLLLLSPICGLLARLVWSGLIFFRVLLLLLAAFTAFRAAQLWWRIWQTRLSRTVQTLDRNQLQLEDSTWLLLQPLSELNMLSRFQQQRVAERLAQAANSNQPLLPVKLTHWWLQSAICLLLAVVVWWLPAYRPKAGAAGVPVHFSPAPTPARPSQATPPRIANTQLLVTPPAYTRLAAFTPTRASFQCPQEARVRWQVRVSGARQPAGPVLELGSQRVLLRPLAGHPGEYFTEQVLSTSLLYQLRYAGTVSDDYAIEVRPDQAPVLRISTPRAYTLVPASGQRPEVPIRATVRDDYGLSRAALVITVAQGQGEAVKFHEVRRDLSAGLGGPQASLGSLLNLPRLGLTYGDELYFYLTARDNHGHTTRTDSYLVQWQDTAVADSAPDLGMGVKVAPAYFRSQRQIIIDTEKLLAEKPRLDAATLASRANDLGFDQQTLRLRYGKFLGEESEAGIGAQAPHAPIAEDDDTPAAPTAEAPGHDEHGGAPVAPAKASPTAETDALMEPYIHKHDDAETADFLEPAVKAKLHAVLDQMWAAELRLRTGQLAAARPFEYRALRLLKEVQQQTRVFVKKAGFTPPPMPEATLRLTGELAGAAVPQRQQNLPTPAAQPAIRNALHWLAAAANGQPPRPADAALLDQAGSALAGAALN
ncbi:MAG: DUF4175 domain-containing protein, partial [Bacteroidota bacterium]|nr:DUF4175 domain-containing protein [Bacteroidota bacterium]